MKKRKIIALVCGIMIIVSKFTLGIQCRSRITDNYNPFLQKKVKSNSRNGIGIEIPQFAFLENDPYLHVPNDFKIARVVPLYKKRDCNYEGNYRPV